MDRKLASVMGLLLLAVVVRLPGYYSPTNGDQTDLKTAVQDASRAKPAQEKDAEIVPQSERGPWYATCLFFGNQQGKQTAPGETIDLGSPLADPQESSQDKWCLPRTEDGVFVQYEFLFVTVPDPVGTHLSLYFDRSVESVQWAAQDAGFYYDRYWLPWDLVWSSDKQEGDPAKSRRERILREIREKQPGLLVFRGVEESERRAAPLEKIRTSSLLETRALLVFLIGETPTAGINKAQFENALRYMREIDPTKACQEVRVLGPSFSGSASSLKKVLRGLPCGAHVISGSATNRYSLDSLNGGIRREEVLHDDQVALRELLPFLRDLGYETNQVALLVEDETAYGQLDLAGEAVLRIRFPREIARLRNAYPDESPPGYSVAGKGETIPSQGLTLSLKDKHGNEDDVPPFSMGQLPLSQEAVLLNIASTLRREKTKFVGIVATDIFDTLFLCRFLRLALPDIRLFLLDTDLLMVRATETSPLEGTLAVTTYPLISRNQFWTGQGVPDLYSRRILFPSRYAHADYNACLALLLPDHSKPLLEYSLPDGQLNKPPLWLTVVGRNGYWPVKLFLTKNRDQSQSKNQEGAGEPSGDPSEKLLPWAQSRKRGFLTESPPGYYLVLCGLFICLALVHVAGVFYSFLREQGKNPKVWWLQWWLEYFSFDPTDGDPAQKAFYLFTATLTLSTIGLTLFLSWWKLYLLSAGLKRGWDAFLHSNWQPSWAFQLLFLISFFLIVALVVLAVWLCRQTPAVRQYRFLVWFNWFLFFVMNAGSSYFVFRPSSPGMFFAYRSLDLGSGVSPSLPFLLVLIAFYVWAWTHLRRVRLWETRRVLLPATALDLNYHCGFREVEEHFDSALHLLLFHPAVMPFVLLTLAVTCLIARPWSHLRSFEAPLLDTFPLFDVLYILVIIVLYGLMLSSWIRFLYVWVLAHRLLRRLERQPLRHAFDRLPKKYYSWAPIWHSGGTRRTYVLLTRSCECLESLLRSANRPPLPGLEAKRDEVKSAVDAMLADEASDSRERPEVLDRVRNAVCTAAEYLVEYFLLAHWAEGGSDSRQEEEQKQQRKMSDQEFEEEEPYILAEEFVALRFLAFIRYFSLQLRNQLSFLITAFILSLISVRSYPFQSHRAIGWGLTAIFLVLGAGIVIVFAQMDKDAILSRITATEPGKLDKEFYLRVISYGALPLLTLLASQFPAVGRFLFSWVQPGLEALR